MASPRSFVGVLLLVSVLCGAAETCTLEVGAGMRIDVAPYGIKSAGPLAMTNLCFGPSAGPQAALMVSGSLVSAVPLLGVALGARIPFARRGRELRCGIGVRFLPAHDPVVHPFVLGGLSVDAGAFALLASGLAISFTASGPDTEVWLGMLWRLAPQHCQSVAEP